MSKFEDCGKNMKHRINFESIPLNMAGTHCYPMEVVYKFYSFFKNSVHASTSK